MKLVAVLIKYEPQYFADRNFLLSEIRIPYTMMAKPVTSATEILNLFKHEKVFLKKI
jgi:hypothetical protein